MDPAKFREALGLSEDDVSDDEVMSALATAGFVPVTDPPTPVAAAAPPVAPTAGSTMLVEASAWNEREDRLKRLEVAEQRHRDGERDQIITVAVQEGKFPPARREHWVRLWNADPEGTRTVIGTLARNVVPIAASGYSGETDEELDAEFANLFPPKEASRG